MKTFLTEANTGNTVQAIRSGFRKPFKLLQSFELFQHSNMSSKVSVSSPSKTSAAVRQKRSELVSQIKESQSKNKSSNLTVRKTPIDRTTPNSRPSSKSSNCKKQENSNDLKSKVSESSDGSVTSSVGSLTSSPKWSHIKKKFETVDSVSNSKSAKSTPPSVVVDSKKSINSNRTIKNTLNSNGENISFIHRNKYLTNKKDTDRRIGGTVNKPETILASRTSSDKVRLNHVNSKNDTSKPITRCASPKNSVNIPTAIVSSLHSTNVSKSISSGVSNNVKISNSSKSGSSESSVKSSLFNSTNISSCTSATKSCLSKPSVSNISANKSTSSSLKSLEDTADDSKNQSYSLNSSVLSKRTSLDLKRDSFRCKQKFEDKPILTFNSVSQQSVKPVSNTTERKSLTSKVEKTLNDDLNLCKSVKVPNTHASSTSRTASNRAHFLESVEKIKDLANSSQQGSKTVWVKDTAGNWVKKTDVETSGSKVASLRSKFLEPGKDGSIPLTKSSTTSSVPSKSTQNSRPITKSNTTSSICDNIFLDEFNKKQSYKNISNIKDVPSVVKEPPKQSSDANEIKESSTDQNNDLKLSIVQRAVLSYEGNIALLSPETQKRLKLVTEKVQAQTDDDKIFRAKTKNSVFSNVKSSYKNNNVNSTDKLNKTAKKLNDPKSSAEPLLPARNFLNRYQHNKAANAGDRNKISIEENKKNKQDMKDARSTFLADISSNLNKKEANSTSNVENSASKKPESVTNNKSFTKFTMNFKIPEGQIDVKTHNQENEYVLQPNSSFLWRRSDVAPSELSKSSTTSSVSLTSSDYRNYYDIENYYSSLELEIEKGSENSEEHIYIDSQESNSSENYYASSVSGSYQNMPNGNKLKGFNDEWTDVSDDDHRKNSISSNQSSTLKKRKNRRHSSYRDSSSNITKSLNNPEQRRQYLNDTISFTDSSDTLINDEVGNESVFDLSDINHLYEPVYESLGNYLLNQEENDDDNCSISLSPDEPENEDCMQCSLTSLESAESCQQEILPKSSKAAEGKNAANKKSGNKISQLKRHLSWTKNDIRLELSSKFNKIKIKKNGRNSTEIGLKMQDSENPNTSPKKKTFIKCILRQKSAGSIQVKRSPSPKKESALFYVHLTMGREKQRPFSDSVVHGDVSNENGEMTLKARKQSDSALSFSSATNSQQQPRTRKFASGHSIVRPKTPPPLPPVQAGTNNRTVTIEPKAEKTLSVVSVCDNNEDSQFYTILDSEYISAAKQRQLPPYENDVLRFIHSGKKFRASTCTSEESMYDESDATFNRSSNGSCRKLSSDLSLPLLQGSQTETLKSPFEEEPMYQFYHKDVQQRATLWYSVDGSESEFEDDTSSRFSDPDYQCMKQKPVLQSQLSAMDLVHGEGGQRRLWCEVPEVIESGILKTITSNDRKIQEAMFEVITSEASYLKSLNFLIEHFVQCPEFGGDCADKHILDKRERHILFSDIQPVRDVSVSLLSDLEKRWLKYIVLSDICDILYHHASKYFSVYVKYCSNQLYQERLLRELKEKRPEFVSVLKKLESNPVCQGLDMNSFLMLPMQRITRLPLLIDAIFRRLSLDSPIYESCKLALATVNKIVAECNEGACKMQRMEEMLVISQQIDFKACKGLGLLSASRWLVKKGELVQLLMDSSNRRTFGRSSRWCKIQLYLFLFTDLLVVTRKKSDDSYTVVDYCPRNMLQVMPVDENTPPLPLRLPSSYRNVFQMIMLHNRDGKTVEMLFSCLLESDRTRWMSAVLPAKSENPDEKIYEEWDCPQVQCTHAYNAQQPDELSLEEADVVNVFKKMADGWFEGERIRDGIRGWFPSSHTVEIINSHVRARNLHQRYRLLMLSQTYLEEQHKAQAQAKK